MWYTDFITNPVWRKTSIFSIPQPWDNDEFACYAPKAHQQYERRHHTHSNGLPTQPAGATSVTTAEVVLTWVCNPYAPEKLYDEQMDLTSRSYWPKFLRVYVNATRVVDSGQLKHVTGKVDLQ